MSVQLCGAYADHVDHLVPLSWWQGIRPRTGSTTRWRRVRLVVLDRDGWRCQLPVDDAGDLVDEELPPADRRPAHPDDPTNLRAACARHNLQRGDARRPAAPDSRQLAGLTWKW